MKITVEKHIAAPIEEVWRAFNEPDEIMQWDGTERWQIVRASNDLKVGGQLVLGMKPNDGGDVFDLTATYTRIEPNRVIVLRMDDDRTARMDFLEADDGVTVRQTFDAEPSQPAGGWGRGLAMPRPGGAAHRAPCRGVEASAPATRHPPVKLTLAAGGLPLRHAASP